jgi:hypothetical protein
MKKPTAKQEINSDRITSSSPLIKRSKLAINMNQVEEDNKC